MKTLLAVDDSRIVRTMIVRHLTGLDVTVVEAEDAQEGLWEARRRRPDLILLDITLPVMDGWQALKELRKGEATKSTPVIMLTTESDCDSFVKGGNLDVASCLAKPFRRETIRSEVGKALGATEEEQAGSESNAPIKTSRLER
jgi:CheY-like chemotaxis protein